MAFGAVKATKILLLVFLFWVLSTLAGRDFYKILGIKKSANQNDIKKAYRKLSIQFHPDKNPDPSAKEKYKEINEAYDVLSDPDKRRAYDRSGEDGVNQLLNQGAGGGNPFDIFGFHRNQDEQRGPTIKLKARVTLNDVYMGKELELVYTRQIICPHCRGSGADSDDDFHECSKCGGKGVLIVKQQLAPGFVQQFQQTWDHCNGEGKHIDKKCHICKASKVVKSLDNFDVVIEKGVKNGHVYEIEDIGDEYLNVRTSTINVKVEITPHDTFERSDNDLKTRVRLTLKEALLGFNKNIVHLDGHNVPLRKLGVTNPGEITKIAGQGMPHHMSSSNYGDLYVTFDVDFPTSFTDEQWKLAEKFFEKA